MATTDNLMAAFAGESQANRKYLAFAQKADADGYPNVAKLFRAAAAAETIHAHAHLRALDGIKSTAENLQVAADGESYEFKDMYPGFLAEAEKEGARLATTSFRYALDAEKVHFDLYSSALETVKGGTDIEPATVHLCSVCGYVVFGEADTCPICKAKKEKFTVVE